ncbi:MAG: hypothetical protein GEU88_18730 [Solirubrobacterales bacterium]|nr:hypothetical protein [Solirubrobacterales bacterium]
MGAFFVCGIAFLAAGAAARIANAVGDWPWGRWLALHLAFVGGVSQLVIGASQFFAGAFLATDPPPRALVRAQLASWNVGAIVLAVAVPARAAAPTWIAVGVLLAGLGLYAVAMVAMRRRSLRRAPWATRWYAAGAGFLALGIVAGALLARGVAWVHGDLLAAHMALNLAGWFGAAIVGTLHTFYPSLTQTPLRHPRLQGVALAGWAGGVLSLALGYGWSLEWLALAGWLALVLAGLALSVNVAASVRAAPRPLSLPARVVGLAQLFLLAGLLLAAATAIDAGPAHALAGSTRAAVGTLLVAGWIGLTVLGSLLHLLAVVVRVRDFSSAMPIPRPGRDRLLALLAALGVTGLALSQLAALAGWRVPATIVLLGVYVLLGGRVGMLAARVLIRARPSI